MTTVLVPACPTCRAKGFPPSRIPGACEFCDGTEGGRPPVTRYLIRLRAVRVYWGAHLHWVQEQAYATRFRTFAEAEREAKAHGYDILIDGILETQ